MGKNIEPLLIHDVKKSSQEPLLLSMSLDKYFSEKLQPLREEMEMRRESFFKNENNQKIKDNKELKETSFFFRDPKQLISPKTAFFNDDIVKCCY